MVVVHKATVLAMYKITLFAFTIIQLFNLLL